MLHEQQPDPNPELSHARETLQFLGYRSLEHDLSWILTGDTGSETPQIDRFFKDRDPISPSDLVRVNPEVVSAAQNVVRATIEAGDALSKLTAAKDAMYETFNAAKVGEDHRGRIDMNKVNTVDDL